MNKAELTKAIADKTGKSQKEAKAFLEAFESTLILPGMLFVRK